MRSVIFLFLCALILLSGCGAKFTNTLESCESAVDSGVRDSCYFDAAVFENELSYCTQISDGGVRNSCINSIS